MRASSSFILADHLSNPDPRGFSLGRIESSQLLQSSQSTDIYDQFGDVIWALAVQNRVHETNFLRVRLSKAAR